MTDGTPRYVSYDRWEEAHRALVDRVAGLERFADRRRGAESEERSIEARITALEQANQSRAAGSGERRNRLWLIAIGIMTGVLAPLIVTTVLTVLHLRSLG